MCISMQSRRTRTLLSRMVLSLFFLDAYLISISWCRLQNRQRTEWRDRVQLLFGDMRTIEVPEKADILVSELLGSFGDNELSPECLDGAMRFLKREFQHT